MKFLERMKALETKNLIKVQNARSACPVSTSLEIIGDSWSLLIIRDLFLNRVTFSDFKNVSRIFTSSRFFICEIGEKISCFSNYTQIMSKLHKKMRNASFRGAFY